MCCPSNTSKTARCLHSCLDVPALPNILTPTFQTGLPANPSPLSGMVKGPAHRLAL